MPRPVNTLATSEPEAADTAAEPVKAPAEIAFAAPSREELKQFAGELERNPAWRATIDRFRAALFNDWRNTSPEDVTKLAHLHAQSAVLDGMEKHLGQLKMQGR